jgi:putative ABC transport system substrate-binding protein
MISEYNLSAKYLELLKEIAPRVTRVAIIRNPANPAGIAAFGALQNAAQSLGVARPSASGICPSIGPSISTSMESPSGYVLASRVRQ